MHEFKDKVVLVTGGAGFVGSLIVEAALKERATHVAILDIAGNKATTMESRLRHKHGKKRLRFYRCDVTTNEVYDVFDSVLKDFKYIDVLVNCAGIMNDAPDKYMEEINVNFTALVKCSLKAYDLMRIDHGGKGGTIINLACLSSLLQVTCLPVYSATKTGVLQFSNCLGMDPHFSRSEVRVLALCFGFTYPTILNVSSLGSIDVETNKAVTDHLAKFPVQLMSSIMKGFMHAYQNGASATTWLVYANNPVEDITGRLSEAYAIMGKPILDWRQKPS